MDDGNRETVKAILDALTDMGVPRSRIYVSLSGGKGYHVEMFFDEIVSTKDLQTLYQNVIVRKDLDPVKVEFRPTHTAAIKLPLSRHARTGQVCWYVDRDTFAPIESADYLLEIETVPMEVFNPILASCERVEAKKEKKSATENRVEKNAAAEARNLGTVLEREGTRHNMMRNMAIFMRTHGKDIDECRDELKRWIEAQNPNLYKSSLEEVEEDIENILNWVFSERFTLQFSRKPSDQTTICASQMKEVLRQSNRSSRR